MKTKSAKAKGRTLQNWVRDVICKHFNIEKSEVYTAVMSTSGTDVRLQTKKQALELLPFSIECKNREEYRTAYTAFNHALVNAEKDGLMPAAVIKMNHKPPLIIFDAEMFLEYFAKIKKEAENARTDT